MAFTLWAIKGILFISPRTPLRELTTLPQIPYGGMGRDTHLSIPLSSRRLWLLDVGAIGALLLAPTIQISGYATDKA